MIISTSDINQNNPEYYGHLERSVNHKFTDLSKLHPVKEFFYRIKFLFCVDLDVAEGQRRIVTID